MDPQYFRILSEWMPNGNVKEYIKSHPEANRLRLVSPAAHSPQELIFMPLDDP